MFKEIYKKIEEFDTIVIARHIGVDPDALASQLALRDSIKLTFPDKKVSAIGTGSAKFYSVGKLDRLEKVNNALLIVLDTPDQKRVDSVDFSQFSCMIKIDHHPFVEKFCDLEYIEDTASSTAEIIMKTTTNTRIRESCFLSLIFFTMLPFTKSRVSVELEVSTREESVDIDAESNKIIITSRRIIPNVPPPRTSIRTAGITESMPPSGSVPPRISLEVLPIRK